jgi:hypothetical protein
MVCLTITLSVPRITQTIIRSKVVLNHKLLFAFHRISLPSITKFPVLLIPVVA